MFKSIDIEDEDIAVIQKHFNNEKMINKLIEEGKGSILNEKEKDEYKKNAKDFETTIGEIVYIYKNSKTIYEETINGNYNIIKKEDIKKEQEENEENEEENENIPEYDGEEY